MIEWWVSREPRERLLLSIAGGLTLLVGLFLFVVQPLNQAKLAAEVALDAAVRDYALMQREIVVGAEAVDAAQAADNPDRFRSEITRMAQSWGLTVSRLQGGEAGTLLLSMDETSPELLFAWLAEIRSRPGGQVISATLTSRGEATVRAVIELRGTMAS